MKNSCFSFSFGALTASCRNLVSLIKGETAFHKYAFAFWQLKINFHLSQCKEIFCSPKKRHRLTVTQEITEIQGFILPTLPISVSWQWCQTFLQCIHGFCKMCVKLNELYDLSVRWTVAPLLLLLLHLLLSRNSLFAGNKRFHVYSVQRFVRFMKWNVQVICNSAVMLIRCSVLFYTARKILKLDTVWNTPVNI